MSISVLERSSRPPSPDGLLAYFNSKGTAPGKTKLKAQPPSSSRGKASADHVQTPAPQSPYLHPHIGRVYRGDNNPKATEDVGLATKQALVFGDIRRVLYRAPVHYFGSTLNRIFDYLGYGNTERFKIKDVVLSPAITTLADVTVLQGTDFAHKYSAYPSGIKSKGLSIAVFEPKDKTLYNQNPITEIIIPGGGFNASGYLSKIELALKSGKRVAFITPGREHINVNGERTLTLGTLVSDLSAALYHLISSYKDSSRLELVLNSLGTVLGPQAVLNLKEKFPGFKFEAIKLAAPLRSVPQLADDLINPKEDYVFKEQTGTITRAALRQLGYLIQSAFKGENLEIFNATNLPKLLEMIEPRTNSSSGLFLFGAAQDGFVPSFDYAKQLGEILKGHLSKTDPERRNLPNLWVYAMKSGHRDYIDPDFHREVDNLLPMSSPLRAQDRAAFIG